MRRCRAAMASPGTSATTGNTRVWTHIPRPAPVPPWKPTWDGSVRRERTRNSFAMRKRRWGKIQDQVFDYLYRSMDAVASFGRMAKFDYLTMVAKLGLAPIEPGSTYMPGATGPLSGARLLFGKPESRRGRSRRKIGAIGRPSQTSVRHASPRGRALQLAKETIEIHAVSGLT